MQSVQIYIENKRIDLFKSESISVNSSVQNVSDISKVFTDFSQSFQLPASKNNNEIFGYYYNNDLNSFDANTRLDARIEINHADFRKGRMQLESATLRDGQIEFYTVTFFGDVVTIKDRIGSDKLRDLDFSGIDQLYDGASIKDSITDPAYRDVRFPLISSDRIWTYDDGSGIDLPAHAIVYDELFPAVSDYKIMEVIQDTYGLTFTGPFLSDDRFKNSFTWWKNSEIPAFTSEALPMTFNEDGGSSFPLNPIVQPNGVFENEVRIVHNNMSTFLQPSPFVSWLAIGAYNHKIDLVIQNTSSSIDYFIDVYINGTISSTVPGSGNSTFTLASELNTTGLNDIYTFEIRTAGPLDFDFDIIYTFSGSYASNNLPFTVVPFSESSTFSTINQSTTAYIGLNQTAPDMAVTEWFAGTLKQFNLTCYPTGEPLTFEIYPLADWYAKGDVFDITQYTDIDTIKVDRLKLYNEVSFKWEKSEALLNRGYEGVNAKQYGCLDKTFPDYDGGKYDIKLPFENLLFQNFDTINGNLQVSFCVKEYAIPVQPYVPKPVKLYLNDSADCSFQFNDGTSTTEVISYRPFGQSTTYSSDSYSINFGEEIDSLTNNAVQNSLYSVYYQPYLVNLFNTKSRQVTLKAHLPLGMITQLSLEDAIILRDKKYRINDMKTDLITGTVNFVLISDWLTNEEWSAAGSSVTTYNFDATGGSFNFLISVGRDSYVEIDAPNSPVFVVPSISLPATITSSQTLGITVPVNNTGADRTQVITLRYYNSSNNLVFTQTIYVIQTASDGFLLMESGDFLLLENLGQIET